MGGAGQSSRCGPQKAPAHHSRLPGVFDPLGAEPPACTVLARGEAKCGTRHLGARRPVAAWRCGAQERGPVGWAAWGQAVRTVMGLGHGVSRGAGRPMPLPDGAREKARTRPPQECGGSRRADQRPDSSSVSCLAEVGERQQSSRSSLRAEHASCGCLGGKSSVCRSARPEVSANGAARLPAGLWREGEAAEQCRGRLRGRAVPSPKGLLPAHVFLRLYGNLLAGWCGFSRPVL